MQITRSSIDTAKGPAEWFTGEVYIDPVAAPAGSSTFAAANVHFTPGARTAWHTHPHGGGFDWGDAGIGAGSAFALTIIGVGVVLTATNRRRRSPDRQQLSATS